MATDARLRRQQPRMQEADSSHNERQRILKSINNDDSKAVGRWLDANSGDSQEALMPNDQLNNSIMHMVAFKGRLSTLRMMWSRRMKCKHRNLQGETALHWAVKCRDETAMRAVILELVTIGDADINATTTYGDTPLLYAIADGNLAAVMELCERGASLLLLNNDGDGAIHLAISSGNVDTVAYVLGRQPDAAQVRDGLGRFPIEVAIQHRNEEIIKMVLLAWPMCLGCRTVEGFLLHDVFPQLGLLHLVEGLGFGDECLWQLALDESGEVHQFNIDVTISGTTFFIEGFQAGGTGSFEVQLNALHWEFDDRALSACFSSESGDCVMKMTANSLATHQKLLRQLDLARLSVDSYNSSLQDDPAKSFKVLSLKKSEVLDPSHLSDSHSETSVNSGRIVRGALAKDLAWLEKLDDKDVDLMIKWGVVAPENAKALLNKRAGAQGKDGNIFFKQSTGGHEISAAAPNILASDVIAPPAPPPRRKAKGAAVDSSSPIPSAPPHRGARGKGGGVSFTKSDDASAAALALITPPPSVGLAPFVATAGVQEEEEDNEPPPPPPPPLINQAIKCANMDAAAILELQVALETGKVQSVQNMLIDRPWLANAPIPPSNEPLLVCSSRAGNIALVEIFVSLGVGCEVRGAGGMSPLHVASSLEMISLLLKVCDPNSRDDQGCTPLHIAAARNRGVLVDQLLKFGADRSISDNKGLLPCHVALAARAVDCYDALAV